MLYLEQMPLKIMQLADLYIFRLYIVMVENPTYTLFACLLHLFVLLLFNLIIKVSDECWQF